MNISELKQILRDESFKSNVYFTRFILAEYAKENVVYIYILGFESSIFMS